MAWWNALSELQKIFASIAVPATLIMVIQFILLLFGFSQGDGVEMADEADMPDAHTDGFNGLSSDTLDVNASDGSDHNIGEGQDQIHALRLFTLKSIIAFFAVGGWTGVAAIDWNLSVTLSIILALTAGWLALYFVAWTFRLFLRMQHSGNVRHENAVGKEGEVYLTIPADGCGKVTVIVQDRLREMQAVTHVGRSIKTGEKIIIIGVASEGVLLVTPKTSPDGEEITEKII